MSSIKIVSGKRGWHLKINGLYINHGFSPKVAAIESETGIPYGATEWVSIKAIRNFWRKYRNQIIDATKNPCISEWGKLKFRFKLLDAIEKGAI